MRIRPDTAGFRAEADAGIKAALAGENPKVIVEATTAAAKAQVADLRTYIATLASRVHKFRLLADDKTLQAQLTNVALQLGKLDKRVSRPGIKLEGATKATAEVLGIDAAMDKVAAKLAIAHVALDEGNTEGRLGLLEAQLTALTAHAKEIRLGISDPGGLMILDELQKKLSELHGKVLSVGFLEATGNAGDAMRQVLQLKRIMQTAGLADFLDINMKPAQIISQLTLLRQRIRAANLSDTLALNVDSGSILKQIAALEGTLQGIPDQTVSLSLLGLGGVEAQVAQLRASMDELTQSEKDAAAAGGRLGGGIGGWVGALRTAIPVFDGVLPGLLASIGAWHLLFDVTSEFLAVLIPAAIGMIAFGAAAIPTAQDIFKQMSNINTVTQATGKNLYPLTGAFQKIAKAVQPQVYQLFGDALTVMNAKTGEFQKLATGAGHALDQLAARATSALLSGGFSQFLRGAEQDIMGLGTVVGNIFGTIGNLLKTLPGYAKYILDFFVTVTHGLEVFTGTGFFQGLAKAGLQLHGAFVYAGLGVTAFSIAARGGLTLAGNLAEKLAVSVGRVEAFGAAGARASGALMGLAAGAADAAALPWGWIAIAAAAVGIFAFEVTRVNDATGQLIGNLNAWVGAAPAGTQGAARLAMAQKDVATQLQGVTVNAGKAISPLNTYASTLRTTGGATGVLTSNLQALGGHTTQATQGMTTLQRQMNTVNWSAWQAGVAHSQTVLGGLVGGLQMLAQAFGFARTPAQELIKEQQVLRDQSALYGDRLGKLSVEVGSVSNAQTLLTISGVTMKQMLDGSKTAWVQIEQAVNATIDAYRAMGQRSGILGADLNALNLAASDQVTQMGNLNTAWDKIIGIVSGGQSSFISFQQNLANVNTAARNARASMSGLNAPSLTLRSNWQTLFTSGSSLLDALRMMTSINPGAQSGSFPVLTRAMKDTLAQMLPLGKQSAATRAEMVSLAQEINPNITDFQQLTKWLGNTKNPAKDLNKILSGLGVSIQNLAKDASTLYATLQNDLIKQFDEAKLKASGASQALSKLATDETTAGTSASKIHGDIATLAKDILKSGQNAQDAGTLILAMGGHINLTGNTAAQKHQSLMNLYEDFRQAGIGAQAAAKLVSILTGTLLKVPKNTTANVDANFTASGGAAVKAEVKGQTWISHLVPAHGAQGMLVPGTGNQDTVAAMLMPGEAVVPKHLVPYIAPWLGEQHVPGFAGGGLVGSLVSNVSPWGGQQESLWGGQSMQDFTTETVQAFWAAEKAAVAAAKAAIPGGVAGPGGGTAFTNEMLAYHLYHNQMSQAAWNAWNYVAMRESGWNQFARNPSSGAYGIAQALPPTKYPFAGQAAGGSNPMAQITWMWNYMQSVYGGPLGAAAHEAAFNWYGQGGLVGMAKGGRAKKGGGVPLDERLRHVMRYIRTHPDEPVRYTRLEDELSPLLGRLHDDKLLAGSGHVHGAELRKLTREIAVAEARDKRLMRQLRPLTRTRGWMHEVAGMIASRDTRDAKEAAAAQRQHMPGLAAHLRGKGKAGAEDIKDINTWLNRLSPVYTHRQQAADNKWINALIAADLRAEGVPPGLARGGMVKTMDSGGWLGPGMNHVWNGTGRLEKVSPPAARNTLQLEFSGRRPDRPLESALWDWIVGNVRIKGAGDVQLALGTA